MKKILTLLLTCIMGYMANPQNCQFSTVITQANTIECTPQAIFMNPPYAISWDFGDGTTYVSPNPIHMYITPGTYVITQAIFDSLNGASICISTDTVSLSFCTINYAQDNSNPSTFTFTTTNFGGNFSLWDFGDGSPAVMGDSVTHTYSAPGIYSVTMNDYNGTTTLCTNTIQIQYSLASSCSYNATQSNPVGSPNIFDFSALVASSGGNVYWDFGDGTSPVSGYSVQKAFGAAGVYNVCMTYINGADTCHYCSNITCTGTTSGNCTLTAIPDSMNGFGYTFLGVASNFASAIQWTVDGVIVGFGSTFAFQFTQVGVHLVCMDEILNGTIICNQCTPVTAGTPTNCTFYTSSNPGTPYIVNFNPASNLSGYTYYWNYGDGMFDSTSVNPTHIYTQPGIYNACLSIYQNGGLVCTSCQVINLQGNNQCQAHFTQVAVGLTAYYLDQSSGSGGITSYSWDFGDGTTSNLQFPQHQYATPGVYTTCLTVSTPLCTSVFCDSMFVDTTISNPTSCNAFFIFTQTSPYQLIGVNLSSGFNVTFMWDFGDNSGPITTPYPSHQYTSTGTYNVCLTVADNGGCTSTYCDTLTVDSLGNIIYRGLTSGGFILNIESPAQVTGIHQVDTTTIGSVYPNPANEILNVTLSGNTKSAVTYKINSIDGKTIVTGSLNHASNVLNIKDLDSGIYLLEIIAADGSQNVKRFVKQ
jgi:PKD repeat protein